MSPVVNVNRKPDVIWTKIDSTCDTKHALVIGLTSAANTRPKRPRTTTKPHKPPQTSSNGKVEPIDDMLKALPAEAHTMIRPTAKPPTVTDRHPQSGVSLQDLCIEDKQRVANLIKELAKVGSEKETVLKDRKREKAEFERLSEDMLVRHESALKERDEIQTHLFHCQSLLTVYQDQLDSRKSRLAQNMSQQTSSVEDHSGTLPKSSHNLSLPDVKTLEANNVRRNSECLVPKQTGPQTVPFGSVPIVIYNSTPLTAPILSSTQKSILSNSREFIDDNSVNLYRSSDWGVEDGLEGRRKKRADEEGENERRHERFTLGHVKLDGRVGVGNAKVGFVEVGESDEAVVLHSPHVPVNFRFADKNFVKFYRKLDPEERKSELLRQRAALENERGRLQGVLDEQTTIWQQKKDALHRQQIVQSRRLAHFEKTGTFPSGDDSVCGTHKVCDGSRIAFSDVFSSNDCQFGYSTPRETIRSTDHTTRGPNYDQNESSSDANAAFSRSSRISAPPSERRSGMDEGGTKPPDDWSSLAATSPILAGSPELIAAPCVIRQSGLHPKTTGFSEENVSVVKGCGVFLQKEDVGGLIRGNVKADELLSKYAGETIERPTDSPRISSLVELVDKMEHGADTCNPDYPIDVLGSLLHSPDKSHDTTPRGSTGDDDDDDDENRVLQDVFFL